MEIKEIRRRNLAYWEAKIGRKELAEKAGYSDTNYVGQLLTGHENMGHGTAKKFVTGLNLTTGWFDQIHEDLWNSMGTGNVIPGPDIARMVPLISEVQAGKWTEIVDNFQPGEAEEWLETTVKVGPRAFALRVTGESMLNPHGYPTFPPGCIIIVDPDTDHFNGAYVVAKIDGVEKATFKKLVQDGPNYYLMPLNFPQFDKIRVDEGVRIIGVVKKMEMDLFK